MDVGGEVGGGGLMRQPLPLGLQSNEYYFELRRKNKVINSFIFFFINYGNLVL